MDNNRQIKPKQDALSSRNQHEILTLSETAAYLKVAEKTVSRMIGRREIPATKVSGQWRFVRAVIDEWLIQKMHVPESRQAHVKASPPHRLSHLVSAGGVVPDVRRGTKRNVIRQLLAPLAERRLVGSLDPLVEKLLEREMTITTAIGPGVAFPHMRRPEDWTSGAAAIVVGRCASGTDFDSLDGTPTRLFFLLCIADDALHLRSLARLSMLVRDPQVGALLLNAVDASAMIQVIEENEQNDA